MLSAPTRRPQKTRSGLISGGRNTWWSAPNLSVRPAAINGVNPVATEPVRVLWLVKGLGVGGIERLLCWWSAHRDAGAVSYQVAHVLDDLNTLGPTLVRSGTPVTSLGARRTLDPRWPRRLYALMAESSSTSCTRTRRILRRRR